MLTNFFSGTGLVCFLGNKCTYTKLHTSLITKSHNLSMKRQFLKTVFIGVTSYSITAGRFPNMPQLKYYFNLNQNLRYRFYEAVLIWNSTFLNEGNCMYTSEVNLRHALTCFYCYPHIAFFVIWKI